MLSAGRSLVKGIGKGSQAGRVVQQSAHDADYRGNGCDQLAKFKMIINSNPICKSPSKRWQAISGRRWRNLAGRWKVIKGWFKIELNRRLIKSRGPLKAYFKKKGYVYTSIGGTNMLVPMGMIKRSVRGTTLRLSRRQIKDLKRRNLQIRRALWNRLIYKNRRPQGLAIPATKSQVILRPPPLRPGTRRIRPMPMPKRRTPKITPPRLAPIVIGRRRPSSPPARRSVPRLAPRPAVRPTPVAPARPKARPVNKRIAIQVAIIRGVSSGMGRKLNSTQVKSLLSNMTRRKWKQLKGLGVVAALKVEVSNLVKEGLVRRGKSTRAVVATAIRRWKIGAVAVTSQSGSPARPRPKPARPRPAPKRPVVRIRTRPRPVNKQPVIQAALIKGASSAMGRKLNPAQVKSLLSKITKQKWTQLRDHGVVAEIKKELIKKRILKTGAKDSQVLIEVRRAVAGWR